MPEWQICLTFKILAAVIVIQMFLLNLYDISYIM